MGRRILELAAYAPFSAASTYRRLTRLFAAAIGKLELRVLGVRLGRSVRLFGRPIVSVVPESRIAIGDRVVLCSWSRYTAMGLNHRIVLRTLCAGATISIAEDVGVSGGTICAASSVSVGARTLLGANVTIVDTDFHPIAAEGRRWASTAYASSAEVVIRENVFIGAGSIILKGVTVGRNAVIGAGSVVTKDIPDNVIAAGNPCRVLRPLDSEKLGRP